MITGKLLCVINLHTTQPGPRGSLSGSLLHRTRFPTSTRVKGAWGRYPASSGAGSIESSTRGGRRPVAHGRQIGRPRRVHRLWRPGEPNVRHFPRRVSQRVEQPELRPVVLGHRGEVFVKRGLQHLQGVDGFLRPADQDEDIAAEAAGLFQTFDGPVVGDDAGAQGAFGLIRPAPPPTADARAPG